MAGTKTLTRTPLSRKIGVRFMIFHSRPKIGRERPPPGRDAPRHLVARQPPLLSRRLAEPDQAAVEELLGHDDHPGEERERHAQEQRQVRQPLPAESRPRSPSSPRSPGGKMAPTLLSRLFGDVKNAATASAPACGPPVPDDLPQPDLQGERKADEDEAADEDEGVLLPADVDEPHHGHDRKRDDGQRDDRERQVDQDRVDPIADARPAPGRRT